jgi:hypothetical protein
MLRGGDLVLFACRDHGDVIIDTVFVVGEWQHWRARGAPSWNGLDLLAKRVHYHSAAHNVQHPEVHSKVPVSARSYQGASFGDESKLFCWVPFLEDLPVASRRPFVLPPRSAAYKLLLRAYGQRRGVTPDVVVRRLKARRFGVVDPVPRGTALFSALLAEAQKQFDIAIEIRLPPPKAKTPSDPSSRHGSERSSGIDCGPLVKSRARGSC